MRKKVISLCLSAVMLIISFVSPVYATAEEIKTISAPDISTVNTVQPVEVQAKSAILMEAETGQVLMEKNAHEKLSPASITKIMTLLIVMEAIDAGKIKLTDKLATSGEASQKGGSQIWLKPGEEMSVDDLLKAAAIGSANDACAVLAEHLCGSEEAFVALMNERGKELGMKNTDFENCTGLDDTTTSHLTTAYDVALMSRELLKHEEIFKYTTVWMEELREGQTQLVNTNKLVRTYDGITGLKTGTTNKAGPCVSATAKRGNLHLISVVMNGDTGDLRFSGARAMLNWGFANWSMIKPVIDPGKLTPIRIFHGVEQELTPVHEPPPSFLIQKGRESEVVQEFEFPENLQAPVEKGQIIGKILVKLDGKVLSECNLTAPAGIEKLGFGKAFFKFIRELIRI